ncbi:hypothetical protein MIR68_000250 [Amoeboaphelidium protococcarum]|nr:hypothetical protein MIR68_000250 [Amoeboaphelidium protococcarum]
MSYGKKVEDKDEIYFLTEEDTKIDQQQSDVAGDRDEQSAYNPETKEINWDCPCLAGMADPALPCTPQFKEAFSCFVFSPDSTEDRMKGAECVDLFKAMQDCFQKFPEAYADQLRDEDDDNDNDNATTASAVQDDITGDHDAAASAPGQGVHVSEDSQINSVDDASLSNLTVDNTAQLQSETSSIMQQ